MNDLAHLVEVAAKMNVNCSLLGVDSELELTLSFAHCPSMISTSFGPVHGCQTRVSKRQRHPSLQKWEDSDMTGKIVFDGETV